MDVEVVDLRKGNGTEIIVGQGTFNLLTVEQIFTAVATGAPHAKFGVAFCEGSDGRLLRVAGNSDELKNLVAEAAMEIAAGHSFIVALEGAYPLQVLGHLKMVPTVLNIFLATSNPCAVLVVRRGEASGIVGAIDGLSPSRRENEEERQRRKSVLRAIGYLET